MYWLSKTTYYSDNVIRVIMVAENGSSVIFLHLLPVLSLSPSLGASHRLHTHSPLMNTQVTTSSDYEPLAGEQEVCPELKNSIISFLLFDWMTPIDEIRL
jgi:hypothetical protein